MHQSIPQQSSRISLEEIRCATVQERVKDEHKTIIRIQTLIPLPLVTENTGGIRIMHHCTDVQIVRVVHDSDLGVFSGLPSFNWILLQEAVRYLRTSPELFI